MTHVASLKFQGESLEILYSVMQWPAVGTIKELYNTGMLRQRNGNSKVRPTPIVKKPGS